MTSKTSSACPDSDHDPIEVMAESFVARFRRGERPSLEEYAARYPELADEVRELLPALVQLECDLSVDGASGSFRGAAMSDAIGGTPRQLGDYTLLREVGRGGMGIVYEAVQQSLGRHVALKILPWHQVGESVQLERFRLEARSAARLHHTNIVPVFGVGEHDGVHYYAMQFIHGQGLDAVIDQLRRLRDGRPVLAPAADGAGPVPGATVAEAVAIGLISGRLGAAPPPAGDPTLDGPAVASPAVGDTDPASYSSALTGRAGTGGSADRTYFREVARIGRQVAEGLAYAHAQGILHRDIKPSNLLIDTRGTVWITDFGLAKAEGSNGPTRTGDIVGTLRYMAPERLEGHSDPRSDVYALGATLYELLALRPIFGEGNRSGLVNRVLHDPPAPPRAIDGRVPRDLETVVLKALDKDPGRRYPSAEALAEDLRRLLADEPIQARRVTAPSGWPAGAGSNPWVAGLAAALAVVTLAALVLITWKWREAVDQRRLADASSALALRKQTEADRSATLALQKQAEAHRQRALARKAVDEMYTEFAEKWLADRPLLENVQRDFLAKALAYYREFAREEASDPALLFEVGRAYRRVGEIQVALGQNEEARPDLQRACDLFKARLTSEPGHLDARRELARSHHALGDSQKALEIRIALAADFPRIPDLRRELATSYHDFWVTNMEYLRRSVAIWESLAAEFPDNPDDRLRLGQALRDVANRLSSEERWPESEPYYRRAYTIHEELVARYPGRPEYRLNSAWSNSGLSGLMVATGRGPEAEPYFQKAAAEFGRLVVDYPESVGHYRRFFFTSHKALAEYLGRTGRAAEAGPVLEAMIAFLAKLEAQDLAAEAQRWEFFAALDVTERAHLALGRTTGMDRFYETFVEHRERRFRAAPSGPMQGWLYCMSLIRRAQFLTQSGRNAEAREVLRGPARLRMPPRPDQSPDPILTLHAFSTLATCKNLWHSGSKAEVEALIPVLTSILGSIAEGGPKPADSRNRLDWRADSWNRLAWTVATHPDDRIQRLPQAVALARRAVSADPKSGQFRNTLGVALYHADDWSPRSPSWRKRCG